MTAHSKLGASGMYRWARCRPGSVALIDKLALPKTASSYAEEGSDAHALGALCLTKRHNPGFYIGKKVDHDGRKFTVIQEMADAVQEYVDAVDAVVEDELPQRNVLLVEQQFDLSSVYPGCFGTADAVVWNSRTKLLTVFDYKHGAGVSVNVKNNPQLLYYGLGALLASGYPAKRVKLVIVQPRCDHADGPVRDWEIDAIDLLDFRADLKAYAEATQRVDHNGNAKLTHRRDVNDDDWRAFRDNKELLSVDEIEAYRQRGNRDDVVAPPKRPDDEGPKAA